MTARNRRIVLAVDPGRSKCGVAVCEPGVVRARAIVDMAVLSSVVREWVEQYRVTEVVVGSRTGSDTALRVLAGITVPVRRIDESGTTLRARRRYFDDHPPRGWRRLLPRSLQTPPAPYDDYAAILLAEAALTATD